MTAGRPRSMALRTGIAAALAIAAFAVVAGPFAAAQGVELIHRYDVVIEIQPNGSLQITETIDYDFGGSPRHGILRDVPVRLRYDDRYDRIFPMEVLSVQASPPGTPAQYTVDDVAGGSKEIKIGDPDRTITGRHVYTIIYRIESGLNGFEEHDELYWNAIGAAWQAPIGRATVEVMAPAGITDALCFFGPERSTLPCSEIRVEGNRLSVTQENLSPYEGVTVVAALPKGAVPEPRPLLDERWNLRRAFSVTPGTVGLTLAVLALGIAWFWRMAWRVGRDREAVGSPVDVAFARPDLPERPVPLLEGVATPVEYTPPDGLRPGQVGTLVDEHANVLDVTASIVDLAVRGYLRIEEIPKKGWFGKPDWRLIRLKGGESLMKYESILLDGLFEDATLDEETDGPSVKMSELRTKFVSRLSKVQEALYEDAVGRGWFAGRPDKVRTRWAGRGILLTLLGAGMIFLLAWQTHLGLVGIPVLLTGILMTIGSRFMPSRTARGTSMVRRLKGFRRYIDVAEQEPSQFAERANLFYEFLPYAVVFSLTEKWAQAFRGLSEMPPQSWYVGAHPFSVGSFSSSIGSFTVTSAGTIASTPGGSGSSGFGGGGSSGGGGGGGGGGSW